MSTKTKKRIYLDYATTTPLDPEVERSMEKYGRKIFGNASSFYAEGFLAKKTLDDSRKKVASNLGAKSDEIIFTSGGTESNNLAILGVAEKFRVLRMPFSKMHMITSAIEHSSVLKCFERLEREGVMVDYIGVNREGIIDVEEIKKKLRPETVLISIMYANNEIGTIQPIRKISKLLGNFAKNSALGRRPLFHTDASQAPLYLELSQDRLGVDLLTLDGHKIYGSKGIGALYVKRETNLGPILYGGGQEKGLRPGTPNVPSVVGFAKALELAHSRRQKDFKKIMFLRDYLIKKLLSYSTPLKQEIILNGSQTERLPNNVNISLPGVDTEFLALQLDALGVAVSTKSACLSGEASSYVVASLNNDLRRASSTLRISLGRQTQKRDLDFFLKAFCECFIHSKHKKILLST